MFPWTRHTLEALSQELLAPGERIEVMVRLVAGSAGWRLRRFAPVANPWEGTGNTEYAVLTDRQLLILAADPGTGRPARPVLFAIPRLGLTVTEVGGGSPRPIDLRGEDTTVRIYVPRFANGEGACLVDALGSPTEGARRP